MCHGCAYRGSFVIDYYALYSQHLHVISISIEIPYRAFPERVGPRILSLESVDYFRTSDYFSGQNKEQSSVNEQNFEVYWKTRIKDQGSGIEDRGSVKKKLEIILILNKSLIVKMSMWAADCR